MAVTKWMTVVQQCLLRRTSAFEFARFLEANKDEVDGTRLFAALFECRESFCVKGDPLVSLYIDHVGTAGIVNMSQVLVALIRRWNVGRPPKPASLLDAFTQTLQDLTMIFVSPKYKAEPDEALACLYLATKWLAILPNTLSAPSSQSSSTQEQNYVLEALAFLVTSLAATDRGLEALSTPSPKQFSTSSSTVKLHLSIRKSIEQCLAMSSTLSPSSADRLGAVVKHITMTDDMSSQPGPSAQASEMQALQFQVSITDTQIVASKAATIVYLESLLLTGQTIDDNILISFLSARHQNDYQAAFIDVFTSSFEVLKAQVALPDSARGQEQCTAFVQNKLPVILSMMMASSFNNFNIEETLTESWHQVTSTSPSQEILTIGHRCLHTCSLLHLVSHQAVSQLMGDGNNETSASSKGLYLKDDLVAQVHANAARGPKLVQELVRRDGSADGSAGPISQAIIEIMHSYCQTKETQYLKDLANALLKKPSAITCISLFIRPSYWLSPLCVLLDDWRWDEIHGEAQPVYDQFGAVFLLVLVTKAALGLSKSEIGIRKKDGFLSEYLDRENSEYALSELSEEKSKLLGDWINALYIAEGLSDDLFTECSPHDFYLLIPTLLRQSITAHQREKLSSDALAAGLEYLLEPFLLPSLVSALNWVGNILSDSPPLAGAVLQVFLKSPSNPESQEIHQTILAKSAPALRKRIEHGQYQEESLDTALKTLLKFPEFSLGSEIHLVGASTEGVLSTLRNAITTMLNLMGTLDIDNTMSASVRYSPSLVNQAIRSTSPASTLQALVSILLQFSESHNFVLALDLISTIISTSDSNLRDNLRIRYNTLSQLLKRGDTLTAEAIVRLYRQVETYSTVLTVQEMSLDPFAFAQQMATMDTANPSLDAVVASTTDQAPMDMDNLPGVTQGDVVPTEDGIDQVLNEAAAMDGLRDSMDGLDGDLSWDALYGDGSNDMNLEDLDALDLDMF